MIGNTAEVSNLFGIIIIMVIMVMATIGIPYVTFIWCESQENNINSENICSNNSDCYSDNAFIHYICNVNNNSCIEVECITSFDCGFSVLNPNQEMCINNTCIDFSPKCEEISRLDFNFTNPSCHYNFQKCFCKDYIIDSPSTKIIRNNSIEIIPEIGHFENYVKFEIRR